MNRFRMLFVVAPLAALPILLLAATVRADCPLLNAPIVSAGIANPQYAAVADVNGDGIPDLVTTNGASQFGVQLGLATYLVGNGQFGPPTSLGGTSVRRIALADFNADGILDIVDTVPAGIEIRLGQGSYGVGDGTFASPNAIAVTGSPQDILIGDFNEDGILDLALGLTLSPYSVAVMLGNGANGVGDGTFANPGHYAVAASVKKMVAGDFNEDGRTDIALLMGGNAMDVLLGNGTGAKGDGSFTVKPFTVVNATASGIVTGDFNHDGITDLAYDELGGLVSVMPGNGTGGVGNGTFGAPASYRASVAALRDLAVADVNGDGIADLVTTTADSVLVMAGLGTGGAGTGGFALAGAFSCKHDPVSLTVRDFAADGIPDAVVSSIDSSLVQVFPGACPASASTALQVISPNGGESLTLGTEATLRWSRGPGVTAVDLQLSRDGGNHWQPLATAVTDTSFAWTVTPPLTGSAKLRVVDPTVAARHDDSDAAFSISPSAAGVARGGRAGLALELAGPNPFGRGTVLRLTLPAEATASLEVVDARGRLVRRLLDARLGAGRHDVAWDGRDAAGRRVAPGVYLARARVADGAAVRKLVPLE